MLICSRAHYLNTVFRVESKFIEAGVNCVGPTYKEACAFCQWMC